MSDRPYSILKGTCFFCNKETDQYFTEDNKFMCDDCLMQYEEEEFLKEEYEVW